eukprot:6524872-Prymnesium_polylepis.1
MDSARLHMQQPRARRRRIVARRVPARAEVGDAAEHGRHARLREADRPLVAAARRHVAVAVHRDNLEAAAAAGRRALDAAADGRRERRARRAGPHGRLERRAGDVLAAVGHGKRVLAGIERTVRRAVLAVVRVEHRRAHG